MADVRPPPAAVPTSPSGTVPKKRKVRKGTQSCWECKRRKIRCTFASSTDAVCDGCKSRQTKCIGQEYQDDPAPASRKADRLKRMESIIEDLVKQKTYESVEESSQGDCHCSRDSDATTLKRSRSSGEHHASPSLSIPLGLEAKTPEELSRYLISFWPSQADLDLIVDAQVCISILLHGMVCRPYEGYFEKHMAAPHQILRRPTEAMHPVLVARNMLLLVTLLNSLPPASVDAIPGLTITHHDMKERLYNAATKLVTSHNDFMTCLEGIESHLMEVMYLTNLGDLRRAWLVNRRAMDLARMMGLQNGGGKTSSLVVLEPQTLERVRPDYMWFRLVCGDRHMSLLLGLPQATTENVFATPDVLERHAPLERFERIMIVACSLILQRNDAAEHNDLDTTYEIDKTLQRAATLLTPQWWITSPPALTYLASKDDAAFRETLRLMNQFVYHHLLVQLHLPYILHPSTGDPRVDCSKITVANASRAILARFISFHETPASIAYCRGIDFIAFIASTTLCLVHIEARRQQYLGQAEQGSFSLLQPLLHQRHSDRGLLQSLLDIVTKMAQASGDPVAKRIGSILGPLLEIELDSFNGGCYSVSAIDHRGSSPEKLESGSDFGDSSNAPHVLRIKIPFFGTIRIEHHPKLSHSPDPKHANVENPDSGYVTGQECCSCDSACGSDTGAGTLPTPNTNCSHHSSTDWAGVCNLAEQSSSLVHTKGEDWTGDALNFDRGDVSEPYHLVPGMSSNDDWALQGVDVALFSSLKQCSQYMDPPVQP
ncbi:C6 zinc finger domain containing protein [Akanthomyces lecanii RCEF 1005]|uniref:C6 zinc finger domain containing protein n=1 Tax=Akanthomyces lecanii RCEF 1005 TaxID=1081108 RepID=A0A168G6T9_CORDF|nr:C6 zinc finger domain containing protein [Akanthomyces lecanii RCEF 1005]